ncbi:MAG: thioredoxin-dependent thiol peroxidase [Fimbriimonas sp.]
MIEEGQSFPDFSLSDQDGNIVTLSDLKGKKAVLFFYPKDDTPGCTTEACNFRDALPNFGDVPVLGISADDAKSHRKFAKKFDLNFRLLVDEGHALSEAVGVWVEKSMYGKQFMGIARTTYVLDEDGIVQTVFRKVKPEDHAQEVRAVL